MKVAVNTSPIESGHKVRGIGSYTKNLVSELKKLKDRKIEFIFFKNPATPPPADVVHFPFFDLFFKTLPSRFNGRGVVTIHDVIPLVFSAHFPSGPRGKVNLFFQKRTLRKIDAVICDSETSKRDILAKLSYPADKIHVIYLAPGNKFRKIDSEKKDIVRSKLKLPEDFVLYVGDVNWNKNISNLLEAIKIAKVNLVMVGSALNDQQLPQTQEISTQIKNLGIQKKVFRTGFISEEDLVSVYNLAKMTALPSFYEGFGLPVLESMACGTPVVCSNIASLSEITNAETAFYCDPSDPSDIAKKIIKVMSVGEKERTKLSEKIQKHAAKFSWYKVASETVEVYKSLA